ncbi:MAG: chorismate synthase [Christensenellales bacterium]
MKTTEKKRKPDCVTEVSMGKSILVVSGYFKENGTKTAEDIMEAVLKAEYSVIFPSDTSIPLI